MLMNDQAIQNLGTELMRIGSILRLNPANIADAFRKPDLQLPVLLAVLRVGDDQAIFPAFISESETKNLGGGLGRIDLSITYTK